MQKNQKKHSKIILLTQWTRFVHTIWHYVIVKSAFLIFRVFLLIFLHEITLKAIDIDNIGCLEPFLQLWEHFWNRVSVQLNCASDLTPRLTCQPGKDPLKNFKSQLEQSMNSMYHRRRKKLNCTEFGIIAMHCWVPPYTGYAIGRDSQNICIYYHLRTIQIIFGFVVNYYKCLPHHQLDLALLVSFVLLANISWFWTQKYFVNCILGKV